MSELEYNLDPIDNFCAISGHSTLYLDHKLYISTGYAPVFDDIYNDTLFGVGPWIRVIDFSKSFPLNETASATSILPPSIVPVDIPDVQAPGFWYDSFSSSIIYAQGIPTIEGDIIGDKTKINLGRNGKTWVANYNKTYKSFYKWEEINTPFPGQVGRVGTQRKFYDTVARKGYMYGGFVHADIEADTGLKNQVVIYDAASNNWTNTTTPYGVFDDVGAAIPYRTPSGKMVGLVFGGNLNDVSLSMGTIFVHDLEDDVWYRQNADGDEPIPRGNFCTTMISAPDNSSTQVILHGGFGSEQKSDIYALSLPSFRWTLLADQSPDFLPGPGRRLQPTCDIVNNRYLAVFGGRNLIDGDTTHCDSKQNALFMYDLNKRDWLAEYNASDKEPYKVPREVYEMIGGNSSGFTDLTEPLDGFSDPRLAQLFMPSSSRSDSESKNTLLPSVIPSSGPIRPVGIIIGAVIGSAAILAILLFGIWYLRWGRLRLLPNPPSGFPIAEIEGSKSHPMETDGKPISELPGSKYFIVKSGPVELAVEVPVYDKEPKPWYRRLGASFAR